MIGAGTMKWDCSVRRRDAVDTLGKRTSAETVVASFRCAVYDSGAAEQDYAGGAAESRSYEVKTRWTSTLAALSSRCYFVLTDGVSTITANITGITNSHMKNRELVFTVEEIIK